MPKVMLVVSIEMKNIALLQPRAGSDDTTINYLFKMECEQCSWVSIEEVCVSLGVKEKPIVRSRRRNYNNASLRVGHGNPLSEHHCIEVRLMLFNYDELIPVTYSLNDGWLAVMIHVDLVGQEYRNVIDGEKVTIMNLEAKFVPRG
ncbi:hypothetical protein PVL29_009335 [Vitis rotundifolia]|uniref:Uncharacterized protein n=1 Tax=Vitis rotundifolia TaxID=103349 RepID=A0AA38ZYB4_VITRO|nr:hypothetical protein PVL29_009335 [Vitis rotundifolia]